jgi:CRP-like cAMP-binding protein
VDFNYLLTLDKNAKTKHFKKGEIIQNEGDKSSLAYYVKEGLLRSYIIDYKGKEHIFMFASEGWFISDIES